MTQQRIYNFGDTLTQSKTKTQASKLLSAGVYEGMNPVILGPAQIELSPGAFLLPNGILVSESTAVTSITYPPSWPPGIPSTFTLTADHDDVQAIGGSAVSYNLRDGLLPRFGEPLPNSVALLWIRHPGSATLNPGMFSLPPKVKNGALINDLMLSNGWVQAPFTNVCDVTAGPNILQSGSSFSTGPENIGLMVRNTSTTGMQYLSFTLPIPRMPWARRVGVYASLPAGAFIQINQAERFTTAPAASGTSVVISVTDTSPFMVKDKVLLVDPVTSFRQVTVVQNISSATQMTVSLTSPVSSGTRVTSILVVTSETGEILPCTPSVVSGPVTGLGPTPAGVLEIASGPKPATIGMRVGVPATGSVFIQGLQFLGD